MLFLSLLALSIKICLAESAASLLHLPTILPRRYTLPALEGADEIVRAGKAGVQRDLRQALIRGNDFMGGDLYAVVGQVFHGRAVSGLLEKTTEMFRGHVQRISHLIQRNGVGVLRFNHLKHPPQLHDLVGCERRLFTGEGVRAVLIDLSQKLEQAPQRDELVIRRITLEIYDHDEYEKALAWVKANCPEGRDINAGKELPEIIRRSKVVPADKDWEFVTKMTLIVRDIMYGNKKLDEMGWHEEALGKNAIAAGFQGQRNWTDWLPNADFTEAIMASTFDWNGARQPTPFATENDTLNAVSMMLGTLVTNTAPCFHDVRTYWSPAAVERVTGQKPEGKAANGFIHLLNSGATALDATGGAEGKMKPFWEMTETDIKACLNATDWCRANYEYFRGGGFSSHFKSQAEMPVTMLRANVVDGIGLTLQIAEGYTVKLPQEMHAKLDQRTDPTWPTEWFVPELTGEGAFRDVYSVMANWGANHGVTVYGHVGAELITLCSMLRIPVTMHNVPAEKVYRPHCWAAFGTQDAQAADYAACKQYGPLYK